MKYTKEVKKIIFDAIAAGDTQVQACVKAGVKEKTFYQWRAEKSEFADLVRKAHEKYRETLQHKLENALWKKATGYTEMETETEYTQDKDGNMIVKRKKEREKSYSPDTAALIFALCNIAPQKWQNKQNIQSEDITDKPKEELNEYHFEGISDDILCNIADALQDAREEEDNNKK
jgi:hypothetical protein bfra3_11766|nr:MAG TPA: terminase small subunit [Caudoviricetes sp.]